MSREPDASVGSVDVASSLDGAAPTDRIADTDTTNNLGCNPRTGLAAPLPVCSTADPCLRLGSGVGPPPIIIASDPPVCRTSTAGRDSFDDGPPIAYATPSGVMRYACLYRQPQASARAPRPLVVWLHGGGTGAASNVYDATSIRKKAPSFDLTGDPARAGFHVLSVQGRTLHYYLHADRDGRHHDFYYRDLRSPSTNPDIANVDGLIDQLVASGVVDRKRIYMMGWSNGAFFSQMYAIARHGTATPGGNRIAGAVAFTGGDPFHNINPTQAPSCRLEPYPRSTVPLFLISRSCDIVVCDRTQADGLAAQGFTVEPGHIIAPWVSDLTTRVGNPNVVWRIVGGNGMPVSGCTPAAQCTPAVAALNHVRWPDGVADRSGIDHEPAMLEFLRDHALP